MVVQALSKLLKGYDCAFFKLIKPVSYVPADVDLLVNINQAKKAASHAIYKERIYTLNDLFTVEKLISKKTIRLAQELNCEDFLKLALNLNH